MKRQHEQRFKGKKGADTLPNNRNAQQSTNLNSTLNSNTNAMTSTNNSSVKNQALKNAQASPSNNQ